MYLITKDNWWRYPADDKPYIECPRCGGWLLGPLSPHTIHPDGTVTNSVVCRNKRVEKFQVVPCDFHEHVKLEDWDPDKTVP